MNDRTIQEARDEGFIDPCDTCQYNSLDWHEEPCESCTGEDNHWKPSAKPTQTNTYKALEALDCISRAAAIDLLEELETKRLKGDVGLLYAPMIKGLKKLPSAQPEIIRCKDCKHRPTGTDRDSYEFPDDRCPCKCEDYWYSWNPDDDWFCANGERKNDE